MTISNYGELKTAVANYLSQGSGLSSRIPEFIKLAEDYLAQNLRVRAMEHTVDIILKSPVTGTTGGTANAITLTTTSSYSSLATGDVFSVTATSESTGNVTLNVDSVGATAWKDEDGSTELEAGRIQVGGTYYAYYDGTSFRLVPPGGVPLPSRYKGMRRIFLDTNPVGILQHMQPGELWETNTGVVNRRPRYFTVEGECIVFRPVPDTTYHAKVLYWRRFATLSGDSDTNWIIDNAGGLLLYRSLVEASPFLKDDARTLTWASLYDDAVENVMKSDKADRHPHGMRGRRAQRVR